MIRTLHQEEKSRSRKLYESCFPADPKEYVDYYYSYKTKDNEILVMEEADLFQVMLHLNPYTFSVNEEEMYIPYIVAVATDESVRKQGKMYQLMEHTLCSLGKKGVPFTFLMPANEAYYYSSGFCTVPVKQPKMRKEDMLKAAGVSAGGLQVRYAIQEDVQALAVYANQYLAKKYDIYIRRDADYFARMLAELEGKILVFTCKNEVVGYCTYSGNEKIYIQEFSVEEQYEQEAADYLNRKYPQVEVSPMKFMFRILNLKVCGLLLRSREPYRLKVEVTDHVIKENNGCFEIYADQKSSSITVISQEETEQTMDISQLCGYLMEKMDIFIREWV